MSAGVTDQRMKGQGNQVTNGPKEHVNEHEDFDSWRAQQHQGYTTPISTTMPSDPYLSNYYGTSFPPYQAYGVGDGTWSNNDPMTFLSSYGGQIGHDSYGMDGMFGGAFGQAGGPATGFNYFPGNGDYSTWGSSAPMSRKPHYDDYYRHGDPIYTGGEALKSIEHGMQTLGLAETKSEVKDIKEIQPKKMTWATIASQPAKPQPQIPTGGIKKKGPGMPPPPMVPGKHNMDIGTWESKGGMGKSSPAAGGAWSGTPRGATPAYLRHPPPPVILPPPPHPLPMHVAHSISHVESDIEKNNQLASLKQISQIPQPQQQIVQQPPTAIPSQSVMPTSHPVLDELRIKNNYNPVEFDISAKGARFFVIKSYSEDDIHRSIKYEIWCSTEHGNKRLDQAYREQESKQNGGVVYLFFSVNGSGHFCGMAKMTSPVDYNASSSVWSQDKWKGQFRVRWIYVKDVPNVQLRHIRLENNENKPVTNSRDTQEVPFEKGRQVLRVMHSYRHSTSIFDDFSHYEKRQEEEDSKKEAAESAAHQSSHHKERDGRSGRGRGARSNAN